VLRHTDTADDGFRCREAPLGRLEDNRGYLPGRADKQDTIDPSVGRGERASLTRVLAGYSRRQ
jgi:hypothetical protein